MENPVIEELSLNHLKSELIDLELSYHKLSQQVKSSKKKHRSLSSQLQTTRQQIEFYTQEYQKALEGLKDSNWKITKEMCKNLRKIENPSQTLVEVCQKFMLVLNQPEKTLEGFKKLSKNFGFLKDLMTSVQGLPVSEHVVNELLPMWKNQAIIQAKLVKTCRCASLMAEWLSYIVEFSLKKETVLGSKRKEPEIEKKMKNLGFNLQDNEKEVELIGRKISAVRKLIECRMEMDKEEITDQFGIVPEGAGGFYRTGLHRPTASDGSGRVAFAEFPNFVDEDLYQDLEVVTSQENKIVFEGGQDAIGCCRMRFFCF